MIDADRLDADLHFTGSGRGRRRDVDEFDLAVAQ